MSCKHHKTFWQDSVFWVQLPTCLCVFVIVVALDSREETVLGSIPLPSYLIAPVAPEDHVNRKYAFKVAIFLNW